MRSGAEGKRARGRNYSFSVKSPLETHLPCFAEWQLLCCCPRAKKGFKMLVTQMDMLVRIKVGRRATKQDIAALVLPIEFLLDLRDIIQVEQQYAMLRCNKMETDSEFWMFTNHVSHFTSCRGINH